MSRRETNACLRDPITVRSTTSGTSIHYHCSFGFPWVIFYSFPSIVQLSFFYLNISPVPTCLVHNCETSQSLVISICCHPCLEIKFPLIPINGEIYLEWTLDLLLLRLRFLLDYILPFPHYKALSFLFDYLPSAYLFSAQL